MIHVHVRVSSTTMKKAELASAEYVISIVQAMLCEEGK